jgi:hypothetical protein
MWLPRRAGSFGISWCAPFMVKRTLHRHRAVFEPKPGAGIQQGASLDFARFYWGGPDTQLTRAREKFMTQSELRRALSKGFECFEIKILPSPQRRPLTRHTQGPSLPRWGLYTHFRAYVQI